MAAAKTLATHLYFSTGDGEIVADGEPPLARSAIRVPYTFATAEDLLAQGTIARQEDRRDGAHQRAGAAQSR
jgi:hypothetical protein